MDLSIIGAGLGRTGTTSLKRAIEKLGLGPCCHMENVMADPARAALWVRAAGGGRAELEAALQGFRSTVDWPAADHWRELMAAAPDALVILTVRDAQSWFDSTQATIFSPLLSGVVASPTPIGEVMRGIVERDFAGNIHDRDRCIAAFERHNAEVRAGVPPERLMEFDVRQGWEPLCAALHRPVPSEPFPDTNTREEFAAWAASIAGGTASA